MSIAGLEQTLSQLDRTGALVKDRGYRQVWRFEHAGRAYYLKFYLRQGYRDRFRRFFRGSPAMAEFTKLQSVQKVGIPAPRAVAVLIGFRLQGRIGDAVIIEAIEPALQLDQYFNELELRGEPIPGHPALAGQIRDLVKQLAKAGFGHEDLHLGNFLIKEGRLYLLDGYAVRTGGLRQQHLFHLGHSVNRYATRTDMLRGWLALGPGGRPPINNPVTAMLADGFVRSRSTGENRYFGQVSALGWTGSYFKHDKYPRRWSAASALQIDRNDWDRILPSLLRDIEDDKLKVIKRSKSGDVLATSLHLGGRDLDMIIKRPRRRYWYRYLNEIGRGSRARRAWFKSWRMILRNIPAAWPLLLLEKRTLGYVTDSLIIVERVPGPTLTRDLPAMGEQNRDMLFRRVGRILRRIEREGFSHFDAKSSNWIVRPDEKLGPGPILVDIDGIRRRRWVALGIGRLLKSMHENTHYAPADSYSLCKGYAPAATLYRAQEEPAAEVETPADSMERQSDNGTDAASQAVPSNDSSRRNIG